MSSWIMHDRLLVRHFLGRFLEHELISSDADRREVLSVVGGVLVGGSLFLSVIIAANYQFNNFMPPGLTSLSSLDDRFLFVTSSMLVMALMAVANWNALALDARDTAVLGLLPIPRTAIIRTKFVAVSLLACGTAVAWNLVPTLSRFVAVPIKLPVGVRGMLTLTLAQGVATLAAGAFGFLAVFGLREGLAAVLGRKRFDSISSALQAALVVVLTSALLLLPGGTNVARNWLAGDGLATKVLPPLWFVGLHETLAGSVIDNLPRTRPVRFLMVPEQNATILYRSLWPLYQHLGRVALAALAVVAIVTVTACAWNGRRLPTPVGHRTRRTSAWHLAWRWAVAHVVVTSSIQQAGFWFTLQTFPRRAGHRAVLASSLAVGLALVAITVRGRVLEAQADAVSVPLVILAAQSLLLAAVLTGFRHAAQLPAELRASQTFSLTWSEDAQPYLSGVKRAAWIALVPPLLGCLFVWHLAVLGVRAAVLHLGLGVVFSLFMLEALFLRYRRVPFVSPYVPTAELKSQRVAYVAGIWCLSFALAWIERLALEDIATYAVFLGGVVALRFGVAAVDRVGRSPVVLVLDETPPLPTQRLALTE